MPLLFLLRCTSIMYTRVMALMSFLKLKVFALMISFISFVQAQETSVDFSMTAIHSKARANQALFCQVAN